MFFFPSVAIFRYGVTCYFCLLHRQWNTKKLSFLYFYYQNKSKRVLHIVFQSKELFELKTNKYIKYTQRQMYIYLILRYGCKQ